MHVLVSPASCGWVPFHSTLAETNLPSPQKTDTNRRPKSSSSWTLWICEPLKVPLSTEDLEFLDRRHWPSAQAIRQFSGVAYSALLMRFLSSTKGAGPPLRTRISFTSNKLCFSLQKTWVHTKLHSTRRCSLCFCSTFLHSPLSPISL